MRPAFLFFCLFLALPAQAARTRITIGFNPAEKTDQLETNGKRLSDYVKRKTELEVKTFVAKDYDSLVAALRSGKVDFAFLPPFSFVKAEEKADGRLLLKAVRKGQGIYYSAIIVRTDSGADKLEDLRGKSIVWVERSSATGYIIPRAELLRQKIEPDTFFGKQSFAGTHDEVVAAVFGKKADAGATWVVDTEGKDGAWQLHLHKPEELAQIKMIHISEPIPGDALTTTNKIWKTEKGMVEQVTKVLQRMGEALDGQQILRDLYGIDKMVPASPKDFEPVRAAAKALGIK
ncbi:MAG TPA: phosphate/phosphite/phosphonate ABC transporter substrate-binding protein [Bdellovibrionota bacterium]|jgi:phosphonate transport system substrate-binding protein